MEPEADVHAMSKAHPCNRASIRGLILRHVEHMRRFDHLVIAVPDLQEYVEQCEAISWG
jgi:hypothetical protein